MEDPTLDFSHHILNHVPMAIIITDDAGLVLWCNDTMANWTQCLASSCLGRNEASILGSTAQANSSLQIPTSNGPFTLGQTSSGEPRRVMRCPLPALDGLQTVCYLDVSDEESLRKERTQLAQQLAQHNTVDTISGLLNDNAIHSGLEPLISRSRRYQNPLSVVTMEITNFPQINIAAGQVAIDKVIIAVSQLLRDQMRWADMVGRLESGQFVFVLPETDRVAAIALAHKLSTQLSTLNISVDEHLAVQPQACFGVAAWEKGDDIRLLLTRSSEAVQTAIQGGAFSVQAG
ncbi:MAG: diguanylate cyclase [Gammaproteobacteria bacterium]|nr:diguanylate cyclase [Gammaproteobacteria bacterium]